MFIVEGSRNTIDFIQSKLKIIEIFATEEWIDQHSSKLASINNTIVSVKEMKKISALTNPSDVLAIFQLPEQPQEISINAKTLSLALDDIHDPGNLGTIIRTADWFGINTIYCSNNTVDTFNPKVVQASMGSLSRVSVIYTDLKALLRSTPDDFLVFGAFLDGTPLNTIRPPQQGLVVIGSEAHGISDELAPLIDTRITIPLVKTENIGQPESLNASIACAVICYALKISN